MISRERTWHPRYGVLPGYGVTLQNGFEDVFTSTATAALEWGAFPYAKGVIDNWIRYYMRSSDAMIVYRAEELAQSGRMLTIFALYVSYTGDSELMLENFDKLRKHAQWLLYRFHMALELYPDAEDLRHGIIAGVDEGDTIFVSMVFSHGVLAHIRAFSKIMFEGFLRDVRRAAPAAEVFMPRKRLPRVRCVV